MKGTMKLVYNSAAARDGVTSSEIANEFNLTSQHASVVLRRLHDAGHLTRKQSVAPTGGYEYIYGANHEK